MWNKKTNLPLLTWNLTYCIIKWQISICKEIDMLFVGFLMIIVGARWVKLMSDFRLRKQICNT